MLWEADDLSHGQLQVLFLLPVYSFSIFGYKECNQFDFDIDHSVMSMCKGISCAVEKEYLVWLVHSLCRIQLAFALFHSVLQIHLLLQVYTEGRRRRGHQRMRWLDVITSAKTMILGKLQEMVRHREAWRAAAHGATESDTTGWLDNNDTDAI